MNRNDIAEICGSCKYDSVRVTDQPCNGCFYCNFDSPTSNWEPMRNDARDKKNVARANLIMTLEKIEEVLHSSGLTWSVSYFPETNSYIIYLSDVESDE